MRHADFLRANSPEYMPIFV